MPKPSKTNNTPVFSLADQLSRSVDPVIVTPIIDDLGEEQPGSVADFIDPIETETVQQPVGSGQPYNPPPAYQQIPADQPTPEPKVLSPDDVAIIAVNVFDGLQQTLLTLFSKAITLTAEERELLPSLDTTGRTAYQDGSREAMTMAKYKKHIETVKELPFTEGEKQRLQDAGIIYARTMNVQVSPFAGLAAALGEVMLTRGTKIYMNSLV